MSHTQQGPVGARSNSRFDCWAPVEPAGRRVRAFKRTMLLAQIKAEERRKHANRRELMVGLGFHLLAGVLDNKRWDVDPSRPAPGAPIEELKSRSTAIERESKVTHAVASKWQPPVRASPCTRACAPLRTTSARAPSAPPPRARWPSTCPGTAARGAHARRRGGWGCLTAAARRGNPGAPPAAALLRQAGQQLERALGVSVCGRAAAGG